MVRNRVNCIWGLYAWYERFGKAFGVVLIGVKACVSISAAFLNEVEEIGRMTFDRKAAAHYCTILYKPLRNFGSFLLHSVQFRSLANSYGQSFSHL